MWMSEKLQNLSLGLKQFEVTWGQKVHLKDKRGQIWTFFESSHIVSRMEALYLCSSKNVVSRSFKITNVSFS